VSPPPPFDHLDAGSIGRILDEALASGARFAELFVERRLVRLVRREEGRLRSIGGALECGAGIRALSGDRTGYAYTSDPAPASLAAAASAAGRIASGAPSERESPGRPAALAGTPGPVSPLERRVAEGIASRRRYLEEVDAAARGADARVTEVAASVAEEARSIHVFNTAGLSARDDQVMTRVSAVVFLRGASGGTFQGQNGGGGRVLFEEAVEGRLSARALALEALRRAAVQAEAIEAPAGELPVVIGNGWGGVLLHEAIGHAFEADFVRRGTSVYTGKLGQLVASEACTVVDDGSIPRLRGSFAVDDEGTPAARTPLIENGVLRGYLHDLLSARALGASPTGNGRRQSFRTPPIPRQSNLFMQAGEHDVEEILRSVPRGLYAKNLGGGQVDIVNGNFVFEVTEGYLIEEGQVGAPVRGANLIGSGPEVLKRIERVGADFAFDPGLGTCGKDGQSQPVGVGQPTVLVGSMTVGGTRV